MKLICNVVAKEGTKSNEIEDLELSSKGHILKRVQQSLIQPGFCTLALACDVDEMAEKEPARDLITLSEWLLERNIELDNSAKHKLANIVVKLYLKAYGRKPRLIARPYEDAKTGAKRWLNKSYAFPTEELHILEQALAQVFHTTVKPVD